MSEWDQSHAWQRRGKGFLIQIKHSTRTRSEIDIAMGEGVNIWNIYVYIYPNHSLFDSFDIDGGMWQEAASSLIMHGSPSYFTAHKADLSDVNKITAFQIGCDYNHLHDENYTFMDVDQIDSFKRDAGRLFNQLSGEVAE